MWSSETAMSKPITLYYFENNQRIVLYPNGYGISRICNMFSHGVEIQVFKWKPRQATKWERFVDGLKALLKKPLQQPFYYEAEYVRGNILGLPTFFGEEGEDCYAQYAFLKPEEESQAIAKVQELK
jgi:hypothetical protein